MFKATGDSFYLEIVCSVGDIYITSIFRTSKNLCPNLQKPPLPSKIPAYAPEAHAKIYDIKFKMFPK